MEQPEKIKHEKCESTEHQLVYDGIKKVCNEMHDLWQAYHTAEMRSVLEDIIKEMQPAFERDVNAYNCCREIVQEAIQALDKKP